MVYVRKTKSKVNWIFNWFEFIHGLVVEPQPNIYTAFLASRVTSARLYIVLHCRCCVSVSFLFTFLYCTYTVLGYIHMSTQFACVRAWNTFSGARALVRTNFWLLCRCFADWAFFRMMNDFIYIHIDYCVIWLPQFPHWSTMFVDVLYSSNFFPLLLRSYLFNIRRRIPAANCSWMIDKIAETKCGALSLRLAKGDQATSTQQIFLHTPTHIILCSRKLEIIYIPFCGCQLYNKLFYSLSVGTWISRIYILSIHFGNLFVKLFIVRSLVSKIIVNYVRNTQVPWLKYHIQYTHI